MLRIVQTLTVDMPGAAAPDYAQVLADHGIPVEFRVRHCTGESDLVEATADADIIFGQCSLQPFNRHVIDRLTRCRAIISMGIGYEQLDRAAASEAGILAANVPDFCLEEVSDHTMALILACSRRIVALHQSARADWAGPEIHKLRQRLWARMGRLQGRTLALLGFGAIARALVPKAAGFGLEIIACDPFVDDQVFASLGVQRVDMSMLLARADILSLHLPLTEASRHVLGAPEFDQIRPGAIVVNTGRGGLIDHVALLQALRAGRVGAAGLDVTEPEPLPPEHEFWSLEQVVITPHSAGSSPQALRQLVLRPLEETFRLLRGQWPLGLINPEARERYLARGPLAAGGWSGPNA